MICPLNCRLQILLAHPGKPVVDHRFIDALVVAHSRADASAVQVLLQAERNLALRQPPDLLTSGLLCFGSGAGHAIQMSVQMVCSALQSLTVLHMLNRLVMRELPNYAQLCPIMQDSELACAGEDDVTDNGPPTKRRKLAATSSKLTVDSECGYAGRVVLTADGCDAYSCTLNQYSLANKFNKYYLMQLLKVIRYPELNRLTRQLPVCN